MAGIKFKTLRILYLQFTETLAIVGLYSAKSYIYSQHLIFYYFYRFIEDNNYESQIFTVLIINVLDVRKI